MNSPSTPTHPPRCRDCGLELPAHAPGGHCPQCLLALALPPSEADGDEPGLQGSSARMKRMLGDYELVEEIAHGGMGVVWKARQLGLDRFVALKTLHAGSLVSAQARLRFRLEVEAVARLNHPNIIALFETAEWEGVHYYTMRLVEGGTLADLLADKSRRPPLREVVALLVKVTRAVQYAHQRGILHRDLKPSNILLDSGHEPLVADFGLARSLLDHSELTQTGTILGSPHYMAPEQAAGDPGQVSTAADIYALGAILYEIVAGHPPFDGGTPLEVLERARSVEPPAPGSRVSTRSIESRSMSRDLDTIALKCLRKEPSARYGSARDLADELERWLQGRPIEARRMGPAERFGRWCRREPILAGAAAVTVLLVLAILGGGILHVWRIDQARRQIASQAGALRQQNIQIRLREVEGLFAADEAPQAVAVLAGLVRENPSHTVAVTRLVSALATRTFGSPLAAPVPYSGDALGIHWRSDSNRIVVVGSDGLVRQWDGSDLGELNETIAVGEGVRAVVFDADGTRLVVGRQSKAECWDLVSGRRVQTLDHGGAVTRLGYSFDRTAVASADETARARVWSAEAGKPLGPWVSTGEEILEVHCTGQSGRLLATLTTGRRLQIWDAVTGGLHWEFRGRTGEPMLVALSPDGSLLAIADGPILTLRESLTGAERGPESTHEGPAVLLEFDPTGRTVVTATEGLAGHHLHLTPVRVGERVPATIEYRQRIRCLAFSRDGERIAVGSDDRTARIWSMNEGRAESEFLQHSRGVHWVAFGGDGDVLLTATFASTLGAWRLAESVAPDEFELGQPVISAAFDATGNRLALGGREGRVGLWMWAETWNAVRVPGHQGPVWWVEFSPDGRRLVAAGGDGVARLSDPGAGTTRELRHDDWSWVMRARFDGSGSRVVTASHDRSARIWDAESGRLIRTLVHPVDVNDASFSPDGRFVVTRGKDPVARLWDAGDGRLLSEVMTHSSWVDVSHFTPNGQWLVTASRDATLKYWGDEALVSGIRDPEYSLWLPAGGLNMRWSGDGRRRGVG
ncbi:MAG: protein kinase, partial [Limisphaerales bacterium]